MQLHQIQRTHKQKTRKRIGRGGTRGKTSGRGHKGQKQHGGHGIRPEMRDVIKKLPKLRGHGKNRARTVNADRVKAIPVNVSTLEGAFDAGANVNPTELVKAGLIRRRHGKTPAVKILGNGDISKKLSVTGCAVSKSASEKIEKAGGSVA